MTFAARALRDRRLSFAAIAEPVDAELDVERRAFRKALAEEFANRIAAAAAGGHLPAQDAALAGNALLGLLVEATIGPLAPDASGHERDVVQSLALIALPNRPTHHGDQWRQTTPGYLIHLGWLERHKTFADEGDEQVEGRTLRKIAATATASFRPGDWDPATSPVRAAR